MAVTKAKRSVHRAQLRRNAADTSSLPPGKFVLNERSLPGRRFVEFPLVKGKTAEKVELFTTAHYHSITIDFLDQTSLALVIEPGFTINAEFQQRRKGDTHVLAEWPPIHSQK
jgi:hypothetical protein